MTIQVCSTAQAASRAAAAIIAGRLRRTPRLVLGLPTGRTSEGIYDELVRLHTAGRADFSKAHTINLDEFVGLAAGDPRSFRDFMDARLFTRVNLPRAHVHFLNGRAGDLHRECQQFDRLIAALGGIDLLLLGLGENGHVGFNEPAAALSAATHRARLTSVTRRANAERFGGRIAAVPREALTMGMAAILGARAIVLVATGRSKARAVRAMVAGGITTAQPASFLQLHPDVRVIVDKTSWGQVLDRSISPNLLPMLRSKT
jgi:glucosamine-6-phosphate deaminase